MSVIKFISAQPLERQELLTAIHDLILENDKTVVHEISLMMGKEMIIYKANGIFKYGLSGVKNHMSLHVLPIYASETLHSKYKALLKNANFQKGCINFKTKEEIPIKIVKNLIKDCSKIDLQEIRNNYLKSKTKKA